MGKTKEVSTKVMKEEEFIPPDGGWGWMIVIAAGFANLSALPVIQQFGLLFRERFERLGISSSEITTIINMNSAFTSCVGLANGPMFRKFTYRQVSLTGATLVFCSVMMTTFSYNFITYFLSFSILYGASYGITSSANALALNTYWKNKRRLATGLSWTMTGLGPIIWPQIINILFAYYGETGAILIISGFSLHAIAFALLLHPVEWHSKSLDTQDAEKKKLLNLNSNENATDNEFRKDELKDNEVGYFRNLSKIKNLSAFSSQYLYNEDDPINTGYEITDPGVPMMIRANDGYFSNSRQSRSKVPSRDCSAKTSRLNSKKPSMTNLTENRSRKSSTLYLNESKKSSYVKLEHLDQDKENKIKYLNESKKNSSNNLGILGHEREYKPKRKNSISRGLLIPESEIEDCPTLKAPQDLKAEEKRVVESIDPEHAKSIADKAEKHMAGSKSLRSFKMDGQYGEKYNKDNKSNVSLKNHDENDDKKYLKDNHSNQSIKTKQRRKSNNFNYESEVLKQASLKLEEYLKEKEKIQYDKIKLLVNGNLDEEEDDDDVFEEKKEEIEHDSEELTFCQKIAMFFDLDLLKDFTFVNLMLGITLANFNELIFSLLTPFILADFGLTKVQIASFMSLLATVDLSVRFCVPFVAGKIGWENNSFFLFGVLSMAVGRVVLSFCQDFKVVILVAFIIGFGKGLRTVFMALVIPTHVPLHKLPGASGLQLITAGVVYLTLGPVVGAIKSNASTGLTLHCLNIFTWLTAASWLTEKYINSKKQKSENDLDIIKIES